MKLRKPKIKPELYKKEKEEIYGDIMKLAWYKRSIRDLWHDDTECLKSYKGDKYFKELLNIIEGYIDTFDADRDYCFVTLFNRAVNKFIREITKTRTTENEAIKMIYEKIKNYEELLLNED